MNRKIYFLLGGTVSAILLAILIFGLFFAGNPKEIPSAQIAQKAKSFEARTFSGQRISLNQFLGKPVVMNFWASWCVSCRQEAHVLESAYRKFSPKGAVFIGIAINDKRDASLRFIRRYGKTYLLAPDDESGSISLDYGVTAVPETFLIDKRGIIHEKILGAVTQETIDDFLTVQLQ